LSDNNVGGEGSNNIRENRIKHLNLFHCQIPSLGAQFIIENHTLETLNLSDNRIGVAANTLAKHSTLKELNLKSNRFTNISAFRGKQCT
jgi:Leucine-rich repeat (LRR) protein